jgi:hypothetical protein
MNDNALAMQRKNGSVAFCEPAVLETNAFSWTRELHGNAVMLRFGKD